MRFIFSFAFYIHLCFDSSCMILAVLVFQSCFIALLLHLGLRQCNAVVIASAFVGSQRYFYMGKKSFPCDILPPNRLVTY